jgi:hypothetical protein
MNLATTATGLLRCQNSVGVSVEYVHVMFANAGGAEPRSAGSSRAQAQLLRGDWRQAKPGLVLKPAACRGVNPDRRRQLSYCCGVPGAGCEMGAGVMPTKLVPTSLPLGLKFQVKMAYPAWAQFMQPFLSGYPMTN